MYDDRMLAHETGGGHPERPDRLRSVRRSLIEAAFEHVRWVAPRPPSARQIERVHTAGHVERVLSARGRPRAFDSETVMSTGSVDAALLAAGGVVDAVHAVVTGGAPNAFALVRPPGHHAEPDQAMGFCLLNNVAIGAASAIEDHGCERVLIVDWDVHHGNGTQSAFYGRSDVLLFSMHQWPLYPGTGWLSETGLGDGRGFTVNAPVPAGIGDADALAVFEQVLLPIADGYRPDLVLVSAGFDAHQNDPLGSLQLTDRGFAALLRLVRSVADRHAEGRLVLVLEGGYDLDALAQCARACVAGLGPEPLATDDIVAALTHPQLEPQLNQIREVQSQYWPALQTQV
jgi:acetoin utilization deacetylase AcuC-like enzyme